MSIKLLLDPTDLHELQDDLESFCYVVLYLALRYLPHNKVPELRAIMANVFEHQYDMPTAVHGGGGKSLMVHHRAYIGEDLEFTDNGSLTSWIDSALIMIEDWYTATRRWRRMKQEGSATASDLQLKLKDQAMYDHTALDRNFQTALLKTWPQNDEAMDHLPPKRKNFYNKRKLEGADEESVRKKSKSSTIHVTPSNPPLSGQHPRRRSGLRSGTKLNITA
jgi:hypothetical protein